MRRIRSSTFSAPNLYIQLLSTAAHMATVLTSLNRRTRARDKQINEIIIGSFQILLNCDALIKVIKCGPINGAYN